MKRAISEEIHGEILSYKQKRKSRMYNLNRDRKL
jgi:hypothetical protein